MRRAVLLLLILIAIDVRADERRLLFIGNSLTYFNEMPWLTVQVAMSLNVAPKLRADFSGDGGMTLRQQWERWAPLTMPYRQADYDKQYARLVRELGAGIAPVAEAWAVVR